MGSLNVKIRTVAGGGRELADMMERLEWCVFVGELMEGEQSEIVGEAASYSVEVQTNNSGKEWASALQRTDR